MSKADGNIIINTKINTDGVNTGTKEIKNELTKSVDDVQSSINRLGDTAKKVGAAIVTIFAVKQIVQFGNECLELGSDLQEVQNVVDVTFPSMTKKVDEFASSAAEAFGLSETMAKRYVGTFGSMAKSFGYSEEAAYSMATALTGLTGDVASFYNLSQEEAYTKLKSVFTGETETLKDLGVVMTQAALDQYALSKGIGKTTDKMTEQEKVALRLSFVQDQLSAASGDFARTSDSWANQVRVFQLQIQSLKATIGQGLINLFTPILKAINTFIGRLSVATTAFKNFTETLMGKQPSGGGGAYQFSEDLSAIQEGYDGAASSAEGFSDGVKEANKQVKKALAPFDNLIVIQQQAEEGSSEMSSAGTGIVPPEMTEQGAEEPPVLSKSIEALDAIKDKMIELSNLFKTGFWEGTGSYQPVFNELMSDLQKIGLYLKDIFSDSDVAAAANRFIDSFATNIGRMTGSLASIGLTIATNIVGGIESFLSSNTERIKGWLVTVFDISADILNLTGEAWIATADIFSVLASQTAQEITGSIIQIFSDAFMGATELALNFFYDIQSLMLTPFIENKDKIKEALSETLEPVKTIVEAIASTVRKAVDKVLELYEKHIHPLLESLKEEVSKFLGIILDGYNTYIVPVLDRLAEKFKEVMEGKVGDAIDKAIEFLGKFIDSIKEWWENVLFPFVNWIAENVFPVIAPVIEMVGNVFLDVFGAIADIIGAVFEVLSGLIDFITGVFTGDWKKAWEGVKEIFSGIWDGIVGIVEGAVEIISDIIDGIKDAIDSLFGSVSSSSKKAKSYSSSSYSSAVYSSIPYKVPRLATGTVVPPRAGEFAAILGDNNRETEVVSPLSTMKQALKEALAEAGMTGGTRDIHIELVMDRQRFATAVYKANNEEKQRVGVRMVST